MGRKCRKKGGGRNDRKGRKGNKRCAWSEADVSSEERRGGAGELGGSRYDSLEKKKSPLVDPPPGWGRKSRVDILVLLLT